MDRGLCPVRLGTGRKGHGDRSVLALARLSLAPAGGRTIYEVGRDSSPLGRHADHRRVYAALQPVPGELYDPPPAPERSADRLLPGWPRPRHHGDRMEPREPGFA